MSKFQIELSPGAARDLRKLDSAIQIKLGKAIDKLTKNPFPTGFRKLTGEKDLYRYRVGDYRIIYQFIAGKVIILVLRIGHRKDIYRGN